MTRGIVASLLALLGAGGLVFAQTPASPTHDALPEAAWEHDAGPDAKARPGAGSCDVDGSLPSCGVLSVEAEYVLWMLANKLPPVRLAEQGNGSEVTLGDEHVNRHLASGARFAIGYWLAETNPWVPGGIIRDLGAEARFFVMPQRSARVTVADAPTLVRPFFDLNGQQESFVVVAAPGLATGAISATAKVSIWGAEANAWKNICYDTPGTNVSLDGMVGLRYVDVTRSLTFGRFSQFFPNPTGFGFDPSFAGNQILEQESFATRNQFYGAQFGARLNWYLEYLIISGQFQLALGNNHEELSIGGGHLRVMPNGTTTLSEGALLALPSNIGNFHRDKFAQVPELGIKIEVPVQKCLILSLGFTALYWNHLIRPGEQVSEIVDVRQIPSFPGGATAPPVGVAAPSVAFNQTSAWLLGLSFNVEVTW
jgi:hypothetical protein